MVWPLALRRIYCWSWNRLHGYPKGTISDDGTCITISTGKCPDPWCYREYIKRRLEAEDDPA